MEVFKALLPIICLIGLWKVVQSMVEYEKHITNGFRTIEARRIERTVAEED